MAEIFGYRIDPDLGLVYGLRGRPVGSVDSSGYLQVDGRTRGLGMLSAHRLIWVAVNHMNGNKVDNRIANLELVDHRGNILHAYATGLKSNRGEKHPSHKLTEADVRAIRRLRAAGLASKEIGAMFGVSGRCVRDATAGRTWTHIQEAVA